MPEPNAVRPDLIICGDHPRVAAIVATWLMLSGHQLSRLHTQKCRRFSGWLFFLPPLLVPGIERVAPRSRVGSQTSRSTGRKRIEKPIAVWQRGRKDGRVRNSVRGKRPTCPHAGFTKHSQPARLVLLLATRWHACRILWLLFIGRP